jgi:hypothetical protein
VVAWTSNVAAVLKIVSFSVAVRSGRGGDDRGEMVGSDHDAALAAGGPPA